MKWQQQKIHLNIKNNEDYAKLSALLRAYGGGLGDGGQILDSLSCSASSHRCHHAAQAYTGPPSATYVRPDLRDTRRVKSAQASSRPASRPALSLFHPTDSITANIKHKKLKKDGNTNDTKNRPDVDPNKKYYVRFSVANNKVPSHVPHKFEVEEKTF